MSASDDVRLMRAALSVGGRELGRTWPNPAVGALLVRDQRVIARGWTEAGGRPHAEAMAIARAGEAARGSTLYVTLEPCSHHGRTPPCADAIVNAGVARVVSAIEDPNPLVAGKGHRRLREAGVEVAVGVCAEAAARAHCGHIARVLHQRPHVFLKMALSEDGKAGFSGGRPAAITGQRARAHVHMMRARHDAIMIGVGTALGDDPALTCRLPGMADRSPVRVVVDSHLRLPPVSRLAQTAGDTPVWVIATIDAPPARERALREYGVEVMRVSATPEGRVDLAESMRLLSTLGITRLMVEGGPLLAESLLRQHLIDEAALFEGALRLGPDAPDAFPVNAAHMFADAGLVSGSSRLLETDRLTFFHRG